MSKIISTTVRSFIRKNLDQLHVKCTSSFDGMTDCVQQNNGATFRKVDPAAFDAEKSNSLGLPGIWFVGRSRDWFTPYNRGGFTGYEVSNACGTFVVAIPDVTCKAEVRP